MNNPNPIASTKKRGFLYIGDKISIYPKDQIGFIDRVLQHKDNVFNARGLSIKTENLSSAMQEVRQRSTELHHWAQMNSSNVAVIALGYAEMFGGGSSYWFEIQYKALTQELLSLGFKIACVVPDFDGGAGGKPQARKWQKVASEVVDGVCSVAGFELIECYFCDASSNTKSFLPSLDCIEELAGKVSDLLQPRSHLIREPRKVVVPTEVPSPKVLPQGNLRRRLSQENSSSSLRRRMGSRVAARAAKNRASKVKPPVAQEGVCPLCESVDTEIYPDSAGKLRCGGCNDLPYPFSANFTPAVEEVKPKKVKPTRKKTIKKKTTAAQEVPAEIVAAVAVEVIKQEEKAVKPKKKKRKRIFIG